MTPVTTIKVPVDLRDRIRVEATARHQSQSEFIAAAIDELTQAEFVRSAQAQRPDAAYLAEFQAWQNADLEAAPPQR